LAVEVPILFLALLQQGKEEMPQGRLVEVAVVERAEEGHCTLHPEHLAVLATRLPLAPRKGIMVVRAGQDQEAQSQAAVNPPPAVVVAAGVLVEQAARVATDRLVTQVQVGRVVLVQQQRLKAHL
jgi:hypothetical protein